MRGLLIALGVSGSLVGALPQAPAPPATLPGGFVHLFTQYRTDDGRLRRGLGHEVGWHKLEVRLKGRKGDVRTRPGYFATAAK